MDGSRLWRALHPGGRRDAPQRQLRRQQELRPGLRLDAAVLLLRRGGELLPPAAAERAAAARAQRGHLEEVRAAAHAAAVAQPPLRPLLALLRGLRVLLAAGGGRGRRRRRQLLHRRPAGDGDRAAGRGHGEPELHLRPGRRDLHQEHHHPGLHVERLLGRRQARVREAGLLPGCAQGRRQRHRRPEPRPRAGRLLLLQPLPAGPERRRLRVHRPVRGLPLPAARRQLAQALRLPGLLRLLPVLGLSALLHRLLPAGQPRAPGAPRGDPAHHQQRLRGGARGRGRDRCSFCGKEAALGQKVGVGVPVFQGSRQAAPQPAGAEAVPRVHPPAQLCGAPLHQEGLSGRQEGQVGQWPRPQADQQQPPVRQPPVLGHGGERQAADAQRPGAPAEERAEAQLLRTARPDPRVGKQRESPQGRDPQESHGLHPGRPGRGAEAPVREGLLAETAGTVETQTRAAAELMCIELDLREGGGDWGSKGKGREKAPPRVLAEVIGHVSSLQLHGQVQTAQPWLGLQTERFSHNVNCLKWNFGHKRTVFMLAILFLFFSPPLTDLYLRIFFLISSLPRFYPCTYTQSFNVNNFNKTFIAFMQNFKCIIKQFFLFKYMFLFIVDFFYCF